ncbi:contractile injection system tape measure protein [Ferruginibacter profundus]
MQQQHTIKKFSLQLQTQGSEHSYKIQRKCIKMVNENLVEGIDAMLTEYFPADEIVRINKIEIDLGDITHEELEKDFVARCMAGLVSKIKKIPAQQKQDDKSDISKITHEENVLQQFFYFLATGKMTWAVQQANFQQWQTAIEEIIKKQPATFRTLFTDCIAAQPQVIERLLLQFDTALVKVLVELYQPLVKKEYENLTTGVENIFSSQQTDVVKKKILAKLLRPVFNPVIKMNGETLEEMILSIKAMVPLKAGENKTASIKNAVVAFAEKAGIIKEYKTKEQVIKKVQEQNIASPAGKQNPVATPGNEADDKSIYINNAGIVILHPFLQNIFRATGLMQEQQFKDETGRQKAVHLLQYLTNKEQQAPEYLMPLNKILCGITEAEHIDRFIQLDKTEMNEADELLEAVITHWTSLKNTSSTALQETFFQRRGKLTFHEADGYWKLQVERKAVDILLDKIPWGISYIQLPWMPYALITEW